MSNLITATIADRQIAVGDDHGPLIAGNVGVDFVKFVTDDSEWSDGYTYTATFSCGKQAVTVDASIGEEMEVPWEVIVPGALRLTLHGFNSDGTEVITTAHMRNGIGVKARGEVNGTEAHEATPDIVQQCVDATEAANDAAESATSAAKGANDAADAANDAAERAETVAGATFHMEYPDLYVTM